MQHPPSISSTPFFIPFVKCDAILLDNLRSQELNRVEWVPEPIRNILRSIRNGLRSYPQKRALEALAHAEVKKIVIGASDTAFDGWVSTDKETLDLLQENAWIACFKPASLDAILAEHVWEHLLPVEAVIAAKTCYTFLKSGGYLRIAVPDGFHPDPSYIELVRPGGTGVGADDHKVLYTYVTLCELLEETGFDVVLLEYFDENGQFHFEDWNPSDGMIQRSKRYDSRNTPERLAYTSIVLDAVKPDTALGMVHLNPGMNVSNKKSCQCGLRIKNMSRSLWHLYQWKAFQPRELPWFSIDNRLTQIFSSTSLPEHERYSALFSYLVSGLLLYRAPDGAHVYYPGASSNHPGDIDAMEGFCRTLPMISAWISSRRSSVIRNFFDGQEIDLIQVAKEGLLAGTNPASKGFWGYVCDTDQRIVEAADIALSTWLLRDHLWPQFSLAEKNMILKWLVSINGKAVYDNNWHLFPVIVNEVLSVLGGPGDQMVSLAHYSRLKSFYQGNGWFSDGPNGAYDYYNAWAIHYALFWINVINPNLDPDFIDSSLNDFVCNYKYLFSTEGIPIAGRSICYRMAAPAPLIAAATKGMDSIGPGMARRALDCVWSYFVQRGAMHHGVITQGYWQEDLSLLDSYSGPGSSLWSTRSLTLAFYNALYSNFWKAPLENLPIENGDYRVTIPEIQWEIRGFELTREVQIIKMDKRGMLRKKVTRLLLLHRLYTLVLRLLDCLPDKFARNELIIYSSRYPFWIPDAAEKRPES